MADKHCKNCGDKIGLSNMFTEDGWKELDITGICEVCFDDSTYPMEDVVDAIAECNPLVYKMVSEGVCVLAGGALRSPIDGSEISDYDLFFLDVQNISKVCDTLIENGYTKIFSCPEGKLFSFFHQEDQVKVQVINNRPYKDLEDIISEFDITACCAALYRDRVIKHKSFVSDSLNKNINFNTVMYPVATLKRVTKYVNKGYKLTSTASIMFVEIVNGMELTDENSAVYID